MDRPQASEHAPYFSGYVALVPERDVLAVLAEQPQALTTLAGRVTAEQETAAYAPGKWTVREVFGHMLDVERFFGHRAYCISRGDQTPLPGFDDDLYVTQSRVGVCALARLVEEFALVRAGHLAWLRRLPDDAWVRLGTASGHATSVRALAHMMAGHVRHHLAGLRNQYGIA